VSTEKILEKLRKKEADYREAVKEDFPVGALVAYQFDKKSLGIVVGYTTDEEDLGILSHPIHVLVYWHKGEASPVTAFMNSKCPVHPKVLRMLDDQGIVISDDTRAKKRERILRIDGTIYEEKVSKK
tara:strand:+ start:46 stop:426 length:381 start_codon:yes stop_codon:yes gene_type:complete